MSSKISDGFLSGFFEVQPASSDDFYKLTEALQEARIGYRVTPTGGLVMIHMCDQGDPDDDGVLIQKFVQILRTLVGLGLVPGLQLDPRA